MLELILEQLMIMTEMIELAIDLQSGGDGTSAQVSRLCQQLAETLIANYDIVSFDAVEDTIESLNAADCIK